MDIKPEQKFWTGVSLLVAGAVLGAWIGVTTALRETERTAAARAAASAADEEARQLAGDRAAVEKKVLRAGAIQPLNAALEDHVDRETFVDLFDNEDWWQPYRDDFTGARLYLDGSVFATWGQADIGAQDADVVSSARREPAATAHITAGGQRYLLAATRLQALPARAPVLVLVRRLGPAAAGAAAAPVGGAGSPVIWILAAALGIAGLACVVASRRRPTRSIVADYAAYAQAAAAIPTPSPPAHRYPQYSVTLPDAAAPWTPPPTATPSDSRPQVLPPQFFGRYRVLSRLGEGGMSEIYTAESNGVEGFTRTFVLKRLRPELARDKEAVSNFIDEARTQASLVHSNIVPVFDFGVVDDEYFMTQEHIVGRDLTRVIMRHYEQTGQCLDPTIAYYFAYETLQALAYAHGKSDRSGVPLNIVHRDISPGNIIVSLQGEVKLSDFGIARANRRVTSTQVGLVKGNTDFMSPEQARGQSVDARSDLFSLAEVLYYCLTNDFLYRGDNDLDVLFKAAVGPTPDHLRRLRSLPDPAAAILEKALAFDPEGRFQSAAEFAEALAPYIVGGKALAMSLMPRLFGKELRHQAA
jgi:tRNA A-37 threonylcarbamoyl transferase component Bud32